MSIQNTDRKGDALTAMRGSAAVDNGLRICRNCLDRIEFATAVGAFQTERIETAKAIKPNGKLSINSIDGQLCYICESPLLSVSYRVSRPQPRTP